MARIRTIKPSFFTSLDVAALDIWARMLFVGLWTHVDDEGRCIDDPRLIKAALFPLDDEVTSQRVESMIEALDKQGLVERYDGGDGRRYLAIITWRDHQKIDRPQASKLPAPSGNGTRPDPSTSPPGPFDEDSTNARRTLDEPSSLERKGKERKGSLSSSSCESSRRDPPPVDDDDEGPSRERIDAVLELVAGERTRTTPGVRNPRQYARTVLAELRQTDTLTVRRLIVEHPGAPDPAIARHLCGDPHALDRWRPDRHCQRCDDTGWIPIDDNTSDRCPDCTPTSEARTA